MSHSVVCWLQVTMGYTGLYGIRPCDWGTTGTPPLIVGVGQLVHRVVTSAASESNEISLLWTKMICYV